MFTIPIIFYCYVQPYWVGYIILGASILLFFGFYLARPLQTKGNLSLIFTDWPNITHVCCPAVAEVKELVKLKMSHNKPRFRKRDKVMFYGRKMMRKVSSVKEKMKMISGQVKGAPGKKRKLVMKLARRLLQKRDLPQQLKVLEPPAEYLQEDVSDSADTRLPTEVVYMLKNFRVFGNFEKPMFLELIKHIETFQLRANEHLFMIGKSVNICIVFFLLNIDLTGEPDTNIYVVQSGCVCVYITDSFGSTVPLKQVKRGESICSLLSFIDYLTGQTSIFKTVAACATEESTVVRLPVKAFQELYQNYPDAMIRAIQIIMVRLQRVTFLALHHYLGLSAELVKPSSTKNHTAGSSPVKLRTREPHYHPEKEANDESSPTTLLLPTPSDFKRHVRDEKPSVQFVAEELANLLGISDSSLLTGKSTKLNHFLLFRCRPLWFGPKIESTLFISW